MFTLACAFILLPLVNGYCLQELGDRNVFHCSFDGRLQDPDIDIPDDLVPGHSFHFSLQVTSQNSSLKNETECQQKEVAAMVGYRGNYIPLVTHGHFSQDGQCGIEGKGAVLFCLKGILPPPRIRISLDVESNHPKPVQVLGEILPAQRWKRNFTMTYGGSWGQNAFHIFTIPEKPNMDLWRLNLNVLQSNGHEVELEDPAVPTSTLYLIHGSSPCVSDILQGGGCFDAEFVQTCVKSVPIAFMASKRERSKVAMYLTFRSTASLTISKGSRPQLEPGKWLVFIVCDDLCPTTTVHVESYPQSHLQWSLVIGVLVTVLGTLCVLFVVNAIYWFAYFVLYQISSTTEANAPTRKVQLWPVMLGNCGPAHVTSLYELAKLIVWPLPFFATLLSLMLGVFLATTAQFVLTHYGLMVKSGNRDICFYNERCLGKGTELPVVWKGLKS